MTRLPSGVVRDVTYVLVVLVSDTGAELPSLGATHIR